ncbi:MAG TPA: carboxypeptidase-like regulatory domain-containing protein [Myxococcota bacterium]|nr:carboxypeptidase-like regulatory domain-containing protein [Myxococcota bacterium]
MADLRLLTRSLASISLVCGCAIGPVVASSVNGRVLDKRTGDPVFGATVFYNYSYNMYSGSSPMCVRWTTTDAAGKFHFGPRPCIKFPPAASTNDEEPEITVLHHDYGLFIADFQTVTIENDQMVFHIEPQAHPVYQDPDDWFKLCTGLDEEACDHACQVAYGSVDVCYKPGRRQKQK